MIGVDEDGEELGAEEALHAGEVGLAGFVGCGDVVAVYGLRGDVVVGVDEDGVAGDAVDLGIRVTGFVRGLNCAAPESAATVMRATKVRSRDKGLPFENKILNRTSESSFAMH